MCTSKHHRQRGLTLIELIVFIVIVSVGLVGLLSVFNVAVRGSADPMIRKQMLSIAEALLEEVELQPFTYCDPTDATWATATSATTGTPPTTCTSTVQGPGPTAGQVRVSTTAAFNNVADYAGASGGGATTGLGDATHAITDLDGNAMAPLGYTASIAIDATAALGPAGNQVTADGTAANMRVVRITVTVNHGTDSLTLEGYRTRYWPNDQSW
jgi:MSHA pilin protein MshD